MKTAVVILVTDPRYSLAHTIDVIRAAARALGRGALAVQHRDRESPVDLVMTAARSLREITRDEGALLVINDSLAIAAAARADGVHFPSRDSGELAARVAEARATLGPDAFLTVAAHTDEDVRQAAIAGASAVLVSPIFATPGKGAPRGAAAIASARALVDAAMPDARRILVHALGGVDERNAADCAAAGANGVAVIRSLLGADDPARVARALAAPWC